MNHSGLAVGVLSEVLRAAVSTVRRLRFDVTLVEQPVTTLTRRQPQGFVQALSC